MNHNHNTEEPCNITIRPLKIPEDGLALAELFNAFDKSWEMGFSGTGKNTAEMALEIAQRFKAIETFVSEDKNGRLIGYCSFHPHFRDSEASYIGILGVHPEVLGKKVGKRLLLKTIKRAQQEGYQRIDLSTWAGNLKAMPLYKKIGLFWEPETAVYMEGFVPLILSEPLFADFWNKHPDWYSIFDRDIKQIPDDEEHNSFKVYTYQFNSEEDKLIVWIDRYAKTISGFELLIDGRFLSIQCRTYTSSDAYRGLPYHFTIEFKSSYTIKNPKIDAKLPNGVKLERSFETTDIIQEKTLEGVLFIDDEVPIYQKYHKGLCAAFNLSFDDHTIPLGFGLKIESAIDISLSEQSQTLRKNYNPTHLELILKNPRNSPVSGQLVFSNFKNITLSDKSIAISLIEKDKRLLSVPVENLPTSGKIEISCQLKYDTTINDNPTLAQTEIFNFEIPILSSTEAFILPNPRKERVTVFNGNSRYVLRPEGGVISFMETEDDFFGLLQSQVLGPPFGFDEFRRLNYQWLVEDVQLPKTIITMSAKSEQRPGLILKKRIHFTLNDPAVLIEMIVENQHDNRSYEIGLQSRFNQASNPGIMNCYLPIKGDSILKTDNILCPRTYADFGTDPNHFREQWIALVGPDTEDVLGILWDPRELKKIHIRHSIDLEYSTKVQPGSETVVATCVAYKGPGNWRTIQKLWEREIAEVPPNTNRCNHLEGFLKIIPLSCHRLDDEKYLVDLEVSTRLLQPYTGELVLPSDLFEPARIPFECVYEKPQIIQTNFVFSSYSDKPSIDILAELHTSKGIVKCPVSISLPPMADLPAFQIEQIEEEGMKGFHWQHPLFDGKSFPGFSAGLTSLKFRGKEVLISQFPTPKPSFFYGREIGGVRMSAVKEIDQLIIGKDTITYDAKNINLEELIGLVFTPKNIDALPEIKTINRNFSILADFKTNELIFRFFLENCGEISQKLFAIFEFIPKISPDMNIQVFRAGQPLSIPSCNQGNQVITMTDFSKPIILSSTEWEASLLLPKKVYALSLLGDFRPAKVYIIGFVPLELAPSEKISFDFTLRLN